MVHKGNSSKELVSQGQEGLVLFQRADSLLLEWGLKDLMALDSRAQIAQHLRQGAELYVRGQYLAAIKEFYQVYKTDPKNLLAVEGMGFSSCRLGKYALAQKCLVRLPDRLASTRAFRTGQDMAMVYVPGGEFEMGATSEEMEQEREAEFANPPKRSVALGDRQRIRYMLHRHTVAVSPFYLSKHCVSNDKFAEFEPRHRPVAAVPKLNHPREPACMTWIAAVAYCKWLSQGEGRLYRPPTEAEWEYAAKVFPRAFTQMHGVVHQWCVDYFSDDYYPQSPLQDPFGPAKGDRQVVRGGTCICKGDNTCTYPWKRSCANHSSTATSFNYDEIAVCTDLTGLRLVCICDRKPRFLECLRGSTHPPARRRRARPGKGPGPGA